MCSCCEERTTMSLRLGGWFGLPQHSPAPPLICATSGPLDRRTRAHTREIKKKLFWRTSFLWAIFDTSSSQVADSRETLERCESSSVLRQSASLFAYLMEILSCSKRGDVPSRRTLGRFGDEAISAPTLGVTPTPLGPEGERMRRQIAACSLASRPCAGCYFCLYRLHRK
jgi:hypothetical protein